MNKPIDHSKCPYCGAPTKRADGSLVWGPGFRGKPILVCSRFPECHTYVSIHTEGVARGEPMGTLANDALRALRTETHRAFDRLWSGRRGRDRAYLWLAREMGIPEEECHIAMFDEPRCVTAIAKCRATSWRFT